jgi:ribonuclease HI
MKWNRARFNPSQGQDLLDEQARRERDPAARWLKEAEAKIAAAKPKRKPRRTASVKREHRRAGPVDQRSGLVIYTDGACEPNPGAGGWAFVVYVSGVEVHAEHGGGARETNNRMEMTAVLRALEWIASDPARAGAKILSDSQYVVRGCNEWRFGWKARGWQRVVDRRKRTYEPVKNDELWRELDAALNAAPCLIEWCKGHVGILGNERADELSQVGRKSAIAAASSLAAIEQQLSYSI